MIIHTKTRRCLMKNFDLSEKEEETYNAWRREHKKKCKLYKKGKQTLTTFKFTPTGIGPIIEIECSCGKKINVTDWESW